MTDRESVGEPEYTTTQHLYHTHFARVMHKSFVSVQGKQCWNFSHADINFLCFGPLLGTTSCLMRTRSSLSHANLVMMPSSLTGAHSFIWPWQVISQNSRLFYMFDAKTCLIGSQNSLVVPEAESDLNGTHQ